MKKLKVNSIFMEMSVDQLYEIQRKEMKEAVRNKNRSGELIRRTEQYLENSQKLDKSSLYEYISNGKDELDVDFDKVISNYRLEIEDISNGSELSPFETHYILHTRSELYKHYNSLSADEKIQLTRVDLLLIQNVEKVYGHLSEIYDFNQKHPLEEWWWHLDKLLDGTLRFESVRTVQSPIGNQARASKGFAEVDLKTKEEKEK